MSFFLYFIYPRPMSWLTMLCLVGATAVDAAHDNDDRVVASLFWRMTSIDCVLHSMTGRALALALAGSNGME